MRINNRNKQLDYVNFGQLEPGDVFEYVNKLYIKSDIGSNNADLYAVNLSNGQGIIFQSIDAVIPRPEMIIEKDRQDIDILFDSNEELAG